MELFLSYQSAHSGEVLKIKGFLQNQELTESLKDIKTQKWLDGKS